MKLTVAMRVIGGFSITSMLLLFLGVISYNVLTTISESTRSVNQISVPAMESSAKLRQQFLVMSKTTLLDYYAKTYEEIERSASTFNNQSRTFEQELALLKSVVADAPELANQLPKLEQAFNQFKGTTASLFDSKKQTMQLADLVKEKLEETEYAADDGATYALDFIDLNDISSSSPLGKAATQIEGSMGSVISAITDIAKATQQQNVETIVKELSFTQNRLTETMDEIRTLTGGEEMDGFEDLESQVESVLEMLASGESIQNTKLKWLRQITSTDDLLRQTNEKINLGLDSLSDLLAKVKARLELTTTEVTESVGDGQNKTIWVILFALAASIGIAITTVLKVTRPLKEVNRVLNIVASGDLTNKLTYDQKDEFGELANNCNKLIDSLRELIHGIVNRSNQLATASEETSMVVKESTVAINDQRSQVEQAASATTEMSSTSSAVMERANEALADIKHADEEAERVKHISDTNKQTIISLAGEIEQAAGVIDEVNHHSAAIGGILDVIRGIAEQTNLLALNAAIEAARAGEQGRGFAVVADEVRSLASKTQESTQEIQNMIEQLQKGSKSAVAVMNNSKSQAELCVEQTEQAAVALNGITDSVHQANDMSEQIVTAANEQYQVSSEISERLESIVAIAEQTAAGASQTDQSSQEVARLAEELRQSVDQFRL